MATFIRLIDYNSSDEKEKEFFNPENKFFVNEQDDFTKIPGSPIAYWITENNYKLFNHSNPFVNYGSPKRCLATGNDKRFVRLWFETIFNDINFYSNNTEEATDSNKKWFPFQKGGSFRKWYGNNEFLVYWLNNGEEIRKQNNSTLRNLEYNFEKAIVWSYINSISLNTRFCCKGYIYSGAGGGIFNIIDSNINFISAYLNSKISEYLINLMSGETLTYEAGDIEKLPIIFPESDQTKSLIDHLTHQCIDISKEEWDSRETSWDFSTNELLCQKTTKRIEEACNTYCAYWKEQFFKLHTNEEELNRIFIDIYDLADELTPDVPLEDITILKDEAEIKDGELIFKKETIIKQFISYAVGCMFGRYSPDREGLILANQGETIDDFREKVPNPSFMPDDDNIIPILEDEYFTDDIVSRFKEFLKATFGAESLAENLDFIAGALSKSKNGSKSPEKTIRNYFLKSFFKDHVKTYKKRPIYWLFTSGKGRGFNALVYMHRYDKTTLAKMRTDYLLELESKLDARMDMLSSDSAREKQEREKLSAQIEELAAYDEVLNNKALSFIDIDLDDGVVVNYAKFEGLVGKV